MNGLIQLCVARLLLHNTPFTSPALIFPAFDFPVSASSAKSVAIGSKLESKRLALCSRTGVSQQEPLTFPHLVIDGLKDKDARHPIPSQGDHNHPVVASLLSKQ